jgi:hypothetical protein
MVGMTGCVTGTLAQQIASTVATQAADHVVSNIVDEQIRKEREPPHIELKNTEPDPFTVKFLTMQFRDPPPAEAIIQPLPEYVGVEFGDARTPTSKLVSVETLNMVIGEEKLALLEHSQQRGSTILPPPAEWRKWQLASGYIPGHSDTPLYFLVPPDFGRLNSGDHAIIEISSVGGLHIARYHDAP